MYCGHYIRSNPLSNDAEQWLSTPDIQPGNSFGDEGIFEIEWLSGMVGDHTVAGPACTRGKCREPKYLSSCSPDCLGLIVSSSQQQYPVIISVSYQNISNGTQSSI